MGVLLHAIGGLCSAIFYLPFKRVRGWAWESYWLVGGIASWIIMPTLLAWMMVPDLAGLLREAPRSSLAWSYTFGVLWGIGGLTFGLTVRYLGIALGVAMALGWCASFGTLLPPIFSGEFSSVISATSGQVVLGGVAVCVAGIVVNGMAGFSKERELPEERKKEVVKEFNYRKGLLVATFCGIASACMSYGFAAGKPIAELAVQRGTPALWQNLPVLVVVLLGGFTTNALWCAALNVKNRSWGDYLKRNPHSPAAAEETGRKWISPIMANYLFALLAGAIWYMQFFFYSMGTTRMGKYEFSSWTLHMASIMIFGTICGVLLKEWSGVKRKTWWLVIGGLAVLVISTWIVGYGNYLAAKGGH